jgi:hypothetical protein
MVVLARFIREPLVHFLVLGAVFFAIFGRGAAESPSGSTEIVVTSADIDRIAAGFAATWQRPPTDQELEGAINDYVREEVLYRTGLSKGLDKDDTIVRRRIRQKMEFFLEDTVGAPGDTELRAFYAANNDKFASEPRIAFRQVFISSKRGDPDADAKTVLRQLVALGPGAKRDGDPLLLPETFGLTPISQVTAQFGDAFAGDLAATPAGNWAGPLKSAYGLHLVLVTRTEPSQVPPFEEVRAAVEREWYAARRASVLDEEYQKLRSRFHVRVETPASVPR